MTGLKLVVVGVSDVNAGDIDAIAPPSSGDTGKTTINSTDEIDGLAPILVNLIVDVTGWF